MSYRVKEIFYTLQGEGLQTGRPAVFCRFSGCNLWSGKEEERANATCRFCDTDFVGTDGTGGGIYESANDLAQRIALIFPQDSLATPHPLIVLTGGEPALQADAALVNALHENGFEIAIETNGTLPLPKGIDWITVSPKADTRLVIQQGAELKLVYPQRDVQPDVFEDLGFRYFFLQPEDGPDVKENTRRTIEYCFVHPQWRLSLQIHKLLGIP